MTVQCEHCEKKFNAPDAMSGKRVRCRSCGQVFTLPRLPGTLSTVRAEPTALDADLSALANLESPAGSLGVEPSNEGDEPTVARPTGRFNFPLEYPYAGLIDEWLPVALVCLSFGWVSVEMVRANELEPAWIPLLRIGIFWIVYTIIVWPLTLAGSSAAGLKAEIQPPPQHAWRVFATFSFPTVLGYILWSILGGVGSFITGAVVGLGIALALHYVLFRLQPREASRTLPTVAAWYGGSLVAGVLLLMGFNFAMQTIMTAAHTANDFPFSPMGHYLVWNPPVPQDVKATKPAVRPLPKPQAPVVTVAPAINPALPAATTNPSSTPAVLPEIPPTAKTEKPLEQPPAKPPEQALTNVTGGEKFGSDLFADDSADASAKSRKRSNGSLFNRTARPQSPLVDQVQELSELGSFNQVILPATPSRFAATVRQQGVEEDVLEVWNLSPVTRIGAASFKRDVSMDPGYMLSPDGKTITRMAVFPALSVQVWSVQESRVVRSIGLNKTLGIPWAMGFGDNSQLWILWELGNKYGLEGWDVQTGLRLRQIDLSGYERTSANFALSPDGKWAALLKAPRIGAQGELCIVNLLSGQIQRRFQLAGLDRDLGIQPSGIAFLSDSTKVAIILEHNGQGLLLGWSVNASEVKPMYQYLFPGGFVGDKMVRKARSRTFDWLADGSGWLINGSGIYDCTSGKLQGELGIEKVEMQRIVNESTVELVSMSIDPTSPARPATGHIMSVTLKPNKSK